LRAAGVEVLDTLPALAEVLAGASVVVSHANTGLAQAALLTGRPQLVFPQQLEQLLNMQLLQRLGVALGGVGPVAVGAIAGACRELLERPHFRDNARRVAEQLRDQGPWDALPHLVRRCTSLVGRS
jgi:UDP:flavonoid glycosyltransferase YjiC (YdhE family)